MSASSDSSVTDLTVEEEDNSSGPLLPFPVTPEKRPRERKRDWVRRKLSIVRKSLVGGSSSSDSDGGPRSRKSQSAGDGRFVSRSANRRRTDRRGGGSSGPDRRGRKRHDDDVYDENHEGSPSRSWTLHQKESRRQFNREHDREPQFIPAGYEAADRGRKVWKGISQVEFSS